MVIILKNFLSTSMLRFSWWKVGNFLNFKKIWRVVFEKKTLSSLSKGIFTKVRRRKMSVVACLLVRFYCRLFKLGRRQLFAIYSTPFQLLALIHILNFVSCNLISFPTFYLFLQKGRMCIGNRPMHSFSIVSTIWILWRHQRSWWSSVGRKGTLLKDLFRYLFIFAFWEMQKFWALVRKINSSVWKGNVLHGDILNMKLGSVKGTTKNSLKSWSSKKG